MPLSPALRDRLIEAIETNALVFVCGAGLSMPAPSSLPSAATVANICYDAAKPVYNDLPADFRNNIDAIAGFFHDRHQFESYFIKRLVPWDELVGLPNEGHAAVADFLITRAAHAAISANFDPLIEHWAQSKKIALRGARTGQEAENFTKDSSPLLKIHGCSVLSREQTLWSQKQLADAPIAAKIDSISDWMKQHLPARHLLIVGFWTDWDYLNAVLENAFAMEPAASVTVVDMKTKAELKATAANFWATLEGLSPHFDHVQVSGNDFLLALRKEFSMVWAQKFYALAQPLLTAVGQALPAQLNVAAMNCDELYDLRRDAEGRPNNRAAISHEPPQDSGLVAFFRSKLINAGATIAGAWLIFQNQTVRVVNGAGRHLEGVKEEYNEPVAGPQADVIVCAGAIHPGLKARIIDRGDGTNIMRPARGGSSKWLTLDDAEAEFGI